MIERPEPDEDEHPFSGVFAGIPSILTGQEFKDMIDRACAKADRLSLQDNIQDIVNWFRRLPQGLLSLFRKQ